MQVQLEAPGIGPLLDLSGGSCHAYEHTHTINLGSRMPPGGKHSAAQLPAVAPCSSSGPCLRTPSQMEGAGTCCTAAAGRIATVVDSRHSISDHKQAYRAVSTAADGVPQDHIHSNSHSCSRTLLLSSSEHTPAATPPAAAPAAPALLPPLAAAPHPAAAAVATLSASAAKLAVLPLQLTAAAPAAAAFNSSSAAIHVPSGNQLQQGPGLLQQLQQLTCSLQEAARLQDCQQLWMLLRLLASVPVTAELLLLSQAGAALRQLLVQQGKQQQQKQQRGGCVGGEVAAAARQLLSRWKAVLAAEVAAADISKQHKALQELLRELPQAQRQRLLRQPSAATPTAAAAAAAGRHACTPQPQPQQQQLQQMAAPLPPACCVDTAEQPTPKAAPAKRKLSSTKLLSPAEKLQRLLNPYAAEQQDAAAAAAAAAAAKQPVDAAKLPADAAKQGRKRSMKQQQQADRQVEHSEHLPQQKRQKQQQLQKPPGAGGIVQRSRASKSSKLLQQRVSLPSANSLPQAAAAAAGPAADTQGVVNGRNSVASELRGQQQQQGVCGSSSGVTPPGVHASWLAALSSNRRASCDGSSTVGNGCCGSAEATAPTAAAGSACKGQQHNIMWGAGAKALRAAAKVIPHHHHTDGCTFSHESHHAHNNRQRAPHGHPIKGAAAHGNAAAANCRLEAGHAAGRMSPPPPRHVTVVRHGCVSSDAPTAAAAAGCGLLPNMQQNIAAAGAASAGVGMRGALGLGAGYVNGASSWQPDSELCGAATTAHAAAAATGASDLRTGDTAAAAAAAGSTQCCGSGLWSLEFVLQGDDQEEDEDSDDAMLVDLRQQQHEGMMLPAGGDVGGLLLGPGLV